MKLQINNFTNDDFYDAIAVLKFNINKIQLNYSEVDSLIFIIEKFYQAKQDWPEHFETFGEYMHQIQLLIKEEINKSSINGINIKELVFSQPYGAWKGESLSELSLIYRYINDKLTIKEVVIQIENQLNNIFNEYNLNLFDLDD